jgi:putative restriction endonuclease
VIKAYDHRCALCRVRIITPEQHTVVDAAHIVPLSRNKNDATPAYKRTLFLYLN